MVALEHFLRVDGWSSHSLLPQGWKIRLKRFNLFYKYPPFSHLFNLIDHIENRLTAEVSKKMFLDADSKLVDKVNNENMKKLSLEERNKLQMLAKRPMKQLKLELDKLVEAESHCEIKVKKYSKEDLENSTQPKLLGALPSSNILATIEPEMDQQAATIEKRSGEPTKQTIGKRIPTGNNLPPDLRSALDAGLISPTELARLMAGELIENPTNNILGSSKDKQTNSLVKERAGQSLLSDDKQTNVNLKQMVLEESVGMDLDTIEESEEASNTNEAEPETSTIISDSELATGWLDNDLLPSGWKLKIACDGKPSDEQVRNFSQIFIKIEGFCSIFKCSGNASKDFHGAIRFDYGWSPSGRCCD